MEDVSEHPISLVVVIQANRRWRRFFRRHPQGGGLFDNLVAGDAGEMAVIRSIIGYRRCSTLPRIPTRSTRHSKKTS